MRVVCRVDASPSIGTGHVRRCLTLATKLRSVGVEVEFVLRSGAGNLATQIADRGFPVSEFPLSASEASWRYDADATRRILATNSKPQWLIVDHYELDHRWEDALRDSVERIMVIDDLANRAHDCDLLLDQNLVAGYESRYTGKVPERSGLLLGPRYALLDQLYAELHDKARVRSGPVRTILVSFGGVDAENMAERTLAAFMKLDRSDIKVDVVVGETSPHAQAVRSLVVGQPNIAVHPGVQTLANLLAMTDLAIGAGGTTTWERLCLGVPSIVISVAANQEPAAAELDRLALIKLLGKSSDVTEKTIASALQNVLREGLNPDWSERCLATVDGRGANRVAAAITTNADSTLVARLAGLEDEALLLDWANDPETRANAFSPDRISADIHAAWFRARLGNTERCRLHIVETMDGSEVGMVRFERAEDAWEVHYSVAQAFRRRGLAARILGSALTELYQHDPHARIFGQVKESNQASRKVFETLGFRELPSPRTGVKAYEIEPQKAAAFTHPERNKAHANR